MAVVVNVNVRSWIFFLQIVFILFNNAFGNLDSCVKTGPCRCEYYNGTAIDLSGAVPNDNVYTATNVVQFARDEVGFITSYYYFHPCSDKNFTFSDLKNNGCQKSSLCYREMEFVHNGSESYYQKNYNVDKYSSLGSVENEKFGDGINGASLVYTLDGIVTTTVVLICSPYSTSLTVTSSDPHMTVLTFYSPSACAVGGGSQHSVGTTLLIVFLVLVLFYFLFGALVKHFLMGAQGIEVIPNLAFWRDLPNLVKDGVEFIRNGFKPPPQASTSASAAQSPNPNSYDSI